MSFTIDQIINLSKQGFTAEQITAFEKSIATPAQPYQQIPAPVSAQTYQQIPAPVPAQPYQQIPAQDHTQTYQPYQQIPAPVSAQTYQQIPAQDHTQTYQPQVPFEAPRSGLKDTSMEMLALVRQMQNANLAQAAGQAPKQINDVDAGLAVLGKEVGNGN